MVVCLHLEGCTHVDLDAPDDELICAVKSITDRRA
jgi:hypothetical protein